MAKDKIKGTSVIRLYKFNDPTGEIEKMLRRGTSIEDVVSAIENALVGVMTISGNIFLDEGINHIWKLVTGQNVTPFSSNSCIGVGDGTDPEDPSLTGLTGTNKYYKQVDEGYPRIDGTHIYFRSTFGPNEANFSWNEWTVANGCGDEYINMNRRQTSMGTKASGATWVLEVSMYII